MFSWWPFPVALAFLLTTLVTPLVARFAVRFGIVDSPSEPRKLHAVPTPLLGGFAIFVGFIISLVIVVLSTNEIISGDIHAVQIAGFIVGGLILMIGGYLDDRYTLAPKISILFPIAAALLATICGIGVTKITNPLGGFLMVAPIVSAAFTFVWLLGMTYTTKLLDGVDGLATSVTMIGAIMVSLLALTTKYFQPNVALMAMLFAAALFGFLLWNLAPARIFLGESGSTFIGFALGVLAVIAGGKVATMLLVLGIPLLDVICVIVRRLAEGRSITSGDRYHLHHLLRDNGLSDRATVAIYAGLCLLFGVTTLIFTSFEKLLALGILSLLVTLLVVFLNKRKKTV